MLHEQAEKPDHVGQPIGGHLEHSEPEILEDLYEELMDEKLYPKFEVGLQHHDIALRRVVRPFELTMYHHLETVTSGDAL